jgi:hypothetical protein
VKRSRAGSRRRACLVRARRFRVASASTTRTETSCSRSTRAKRAPTRRCCCARPTKRKEPRTRGWFSTTIVYVGESHSGRLADTLTRHFQAWNRDKKFWRGQYAPDQTDPGHTYPRESCEVAYELCSKNKAVELQRAWIRRLKPRDNVALVDDEQEEAPF